MPAKKKSMLTSKEKIESASDFIARLAAGIRFCLKQNEVEPKEKLVSDLWEYIIEIVEMYLQSTFVAPEALDNMIDELKLDYYMDADTRKYFGKNQDHLFQNYAGTEVYQRLEHTINTALDAFRLDIKHFLRYEMEKNKQKPKLPEA